MLKVVWESFLGNHNPQLREGLWMLEGTLKQETKDKDSCSHRHLLALFRLLRTRDSCFMESYSGSYRGRHYQKFFARDEQCYEPSDDPVIDLRIVGLMV